MATQVWRQLSLNGSAVGSVGLIIEEGGLHGDDVLRLAMISLEVVLVEPKPNDVVHIAALGQSKQHVVAVFVVD